MRTWAVAGDWAPARAGAAVRAARATKVALRATVRRRSMRIFCRGRWSGWVGAGDGGRNRSGPGGVGDAQRGVVAVADLDVDGERPVGGELLAEEGGDRRDLGATGRHRPEVD